MDKTRQLWLLTVLAVVGVFVGGYFLLIQPKTKEASEIRQDVAAAEAKNRQLVGQIAMLKEMEKQLPKEQARLTELGKKIPDTPALPTFIRSVSDTADASKVELLALNPQEPTFTTSAPAGPVTPASPAPGAGTGTGTGTTDVGLPAAPVPSLAILPVEIRVRAHFAQLREFIAGMEDLQRAYLVQGLDITPWCRGNDGAAPGADCDEDELGLVIRARVFVAKVRQQAAPVAPAAPATTEGS